MSEDCFRKNKSVIILNLTCWCQ